jgi:hypothetical protein
VTAVIVSLYGASAVCGGLFCYAWLRWRRIGVRPVVDCAALASVRPGALVMVAGHTAGGPVLTAPLSGWACVWYEVVRQKTRYVSSNYEETTSDVEATAGDAGVYGPGGGRVEIAPELGQRSLLSGRPPMMRALGDRDGGRDSTYSYRLHEHRVVADVPIVATGVVVETEPGLRRLDRGSWVDGCTQARLDELPSRYARFRRWTLVASVLLTGLATLLTTTGLGH